MWQEDPDYSDVVIDRAQRGEPSPTEVGSSSASLPERALLRAVLQEAILDVKGYATGMSHKDRRRAALQAYYWVLSRDLTWPFSFENVCVVLGFDPDCLRRWLLRDAPVGAHAAESGTRALVRGGGMVRAVRAARMRGNQQKQPLRIRRRSSAPGARSRVATVALGERGQ
jgi:hypothetical protein